MKRFLSPRRRAQRGAAAVEAALGIALLTGVFILAADMARIGIERARLENAAGSAALNIATQTKLTQAGLDALAKVAMQGYEDQQELVILNVLQSGRIQWGVRRGSDQGICPELSAGGVYNGTLPEDPPTTSSTSASSTDASTMSLIVVEACRDTRNVALSTLSMPSPLSVRSAFRATSSVVSLDDALQSESDATGLSYSTNQSSSSS